MIICLVCRPWIKKSDLALNESGPMGLRPKLCDLVMRLGEVRLGQLVFYFKLGLRRVPCRLGLALTESGPKSKCFFFVTDAMKNVVLPT